MRDAQRRKRLHQLTARQLICHIDLHGERYAEPLTGRREGVIVTVERQTCIRIQVAQSCAVQPVLPVGARGMDLQERCPLQIGGLL